MKPTLFARDNRTMGAEERRSGSACWAVWRFLQLLARAAKCGCVDSIRRLSGEPEPDQLQPDLTSAV